MSQQSQGIFSALQVLSQQLLRRRDLLAFPLLAALVAQLQLDTLEAMVGRPFNRLWWGVLLSMARLLQLPLDHLAALHRSRFRVLVVVILRFRLTTRSIR